MQNYFSNQKENIFRNVGVLIYVFDVESSTAQVLIPLAFFSCTVEVFFQVFL